MIILSFLTAIGVHGHYRKLGPERPCGIISVIFNSLQELGSEAQNKLDNNEELDM